MNYKMWLNVDEEGNVVKSVDGREDIAVEPVKSYEYHFTVDEYTMRNIHVFKVIDGVLVQQEQPQEREPSIVIEEPVE
jgi:hypothetical protein